jgi:DNA-binding transcriptional MerR regulator
VTRHPNRVLPDDAEGSAADAPEKRYYRIGEVSKLTGVKPYVLRYWESEFRWMSPQKSRSKQRLYRKRDIDMILMIKKLLYGQRYTIAGARKKLREMGVGNALQTGELAFETDHRARYRKLREELAAIRAML